MQSMHAFLIAVACGVSLALVTCWIFHRALGTILQELCGSASRARFWVLFGDVGLVLCTLWTGLWFVPEGAGTGAAAVVFVRTLKGATFGLLLTICVLGLTLGSGIRSLQERRVLEVPSFAKKTPRENESSPS